LSQAESAKGSGALLGNIYMKTLMMLFEYR